MILPFILIIHYLCWDCFFLMWPSLKSYIQGVGGSQWLKGEGGGKPADSFHICLSKPWEVSRAWDVKPGCKHIMNFIFSTVKFHNGHLLVLMCPYFFSVPFAELTHSFCFAKRPDSFALNKVQLCYSYSYGTVCRYISQTVVLPCSQIDLNLLFVLCKIQIPVSFLITPVFISYLKKYENGYILTVFWSQNLKSTIL